MIPFRPIRSEIEAGRIAFDPYDEAMVQPSSVDVRVDGKFRVFHNARYPYIDVRQPMEDLTELVEIGSGRDDKYGCEFRQDDAERQVARIQAHGPRRLQ